MYNIDLEQLNNQELVEILNALEGLKDTLKEKSGDSDEE